MEAKAAQLLFFNVGRQKRLLLSLTKSVKAAFARRSEEYFGEGEV
jgi:hypothetical protein